MIVKRESDSQAISWENKRITKKSAEFEKQFPMLLIIVDHINLQRVQA